MESAKNDFYHFEGINRDVNPLESKDSDLLSSINWYSYRYGSKKVRFGYTPFLDAVDSSQVRNIIYYNLPSGTGLLRVSGGNIYKYTGSGNAWGTPVKTGITESKKWCSASLDGSIPYLHLGNDTDGYWTFDNNNFKHWTGAYTTKPSVMASWQSRIFMDLNKRSLVESAISFDLNGGYQTDPFTINNNDPAGGGSVSLNAGAQGGIIDITSSVDRINIYKQFGAIRYNGQQFMNFPYSGHILAIAPTKENVDYILADNGIYKNNGSSIAPSDFGIMQIIQDTIQAHGITNPIGFSFNDLTIFFIGTIRIGQGDGAIDVQNGCLVHHERYDLWDVWSLGHQMTSFGSYIDSNNNPIMLSGDVNGNIYSWGEQYSSDAGIPISYHLRTAYHNFGDYSNTKFPDRYYFSILNADSITMSCATDYSDIYQYEQDFLAGMLKKDWFNGLYDYKSISFELKGATTTTRPELLGYTIRHKDNEDRYDNPGQSKRK
jgi:hypothetical protein